MTSATARADPRGGFTGVTVVAHSPLVEKGDLGAKDTYFRTSIRANCQKASSEKTEQEAMSGIDEYEDRELQSKLANLRISTNAEAAACTTSRKEKGWTYHVNKLPRDGRRRV